MRFQNNKAKYKNLNLSEKMTGDIYRNESKNGFLIEAQNGRRK